MSFFERVGRQPRSWLMVQAVAFVAVVAVIDLLTTWRVSMYIFYCLPVYAVAVYFSRRVAIAFALLTAVVGTVAHFDRLAVRGMGNYAWAAVNRTGALLFAAGCGISFRRNREEADRRIEALHRSQGLELEVVCAAELERQKIGQDLHDGLCQTLVALDCAAQCLRLDLESDRSPRSNLAGQLQRQLSSAALEARNMARGNYPVSLSAETLPLAMEELATTMSRLFSGRVGVSIQPDLPIADADVAVHLYRITQEALSNALRHANATRIDIGLCRQGEHLVLTVTDNGCGSALQQRPKGMGWHTMRYRANLVGAQFKMTSQPGEGTTIRCELPAASARPEVSVTPSMAPLAVGSSQEKDV